MRMTSSLLFTFTTAFYLVSVLLFFAFIASKVKVFGLAGRAVVVWGLLLQTAAIGLRWCESYAVGAGHAPLYNRYESAVFFSFAIVIIYLLLDLRFRYLVIGAFVMPFALLGMAWTHFGLDSSFAQLVPAQLSYWLPVHMIARFLGLVAFAIACGLSIMNLVCQRVGTPPPAGPSALVNFPPAKVLDDLIYRAIIVGFSLLTLAITTGAAWAKYAWGTYWNWDLQEIWSMITWFVYATFLHARITRGWMGRPAAWLSVLGFAAALFYYFGVDLMLPGLSNVGGGN
jgi:cytochrome c-type biogenesis protein CcsB